MDEATGSFVRSGRRGADATDDDAESEEGRNGFYQGGRLRARAVPTGSFPTKRAVAHLHINDVEKGTTDYTWKIEMKTRFRAGHTKSPTAQRAFTKKTLRIAELAGKKGRTGRDPRHPVPRPRPVFTDLDRPVEGRGA